MREGGEAVSEQKRVDPSRIAEELRELGRQLTEAVRSVAGSEEAQKLRQELAEGLRTIAKEVEEVTEKVREREETQKLREQAKHLSESVKSGEATKKLREELADALSALNKQLSHLVERLREQAEEGEAASSAGESQGGE